MSEDSHPLNHADRRQIVLHEIRGAQVQNVQTADSIEFLLRRVQPRDWPGAFRNLRAVAAQVHRVTQARTPLRLSRSHRSPAPGPSREVIGGNSKYAARAPLKALVSATAAVN